MVQKQLTHLVAKGGHAVGSAEKAEGGRWREPCPGVLSFSVGRRLGGTLLELWKEVAVRTPTLCNRAMVPFLLKVQSCTPPWC